MNYNPSLCSRGIATLLLIGSALALAGACSSKRPAPEPTTGSSEQDRLRVSCEFAILHLERLIAVRLEETDFPLAILLEAQELHQLGKELYLQGEYELALELIEDGIALVKEDSD